MENEGEGTMDKETIRNLENREEHLENEFYQLASLALDSSSDNDRDINDLMTAMNATRKALNAVRRVLRRYQR